MPTCVPALLSRLDQASNDMEFPGWDHGHYTAFTGAMRASGFISPLGVGLTFEQIEYSFGERALQCKTFCFATFPTVDWLHIGRAVYMASDEMNNPETGEFSLGFGSVKVSSRGRAFTIPFERDELVRGGYLDSDAKAPTREALLFKICDTIPQEWLYSEESYLRQAFGMGTDTQRLFIVEAWEHPSVDEVYGDEIRPSQWPDIVALVEAVCTKKTKPKLTGIPNTSWRQRYSKK